MTTRTWFICGGSLCAVAILWHFAVSPILLHRVPAGWSWSSNFVGISTFADENSVYPEEDAPTFYKRVFLPLPVEGRDDAISMVLEYSTRDPETSEIIWKSAIATLVEPRTGEYAGPDRTDEISVFPRFTQKRDYRIRISYLKGILIRFAGEETIGGLTTYVYRYKGPIEYPEAYKSTEGYQGVDVKPGQTIRCDDDQFINNLWVEPVTGEIVKWEDSCLSGDSVFDIDSGEKLYNLARWGGVNRGDDILEKVQQLRWERLEMLAMTRYLPALLLALGVLMAGLGLRNRDGA